MTDDNIEDLLDIVGTDEGMDHALSQAQKIERQNIEPSEIDTLNIQVNSKVEELERGAGSEIKKLDEAKDSLSDMMSTDQFEEDKQSGLVEYGILQQALAVIEYYEDLLPRYIISKELSYNLKNELKAKFNQSKMVNDEARVEKMIDKSLEFNEKQLERISSQFEKTMDKQVDEVGSAAESLQNLNNLEETAVNEIQELRKERENQQEIQREMVQVLREVSSLIRSASPPQPGRTENSSGTGTHRSTRSQGSSESSEEVVRRELGEEFTGDMSQNGSDRANTSSMETSEESDDGSFEESDESESVSESSESSDSVSSSEDGSSDLPEWANDEKDVKLKELYQEKRKDPKFQYELLIDSDQDEYVELDHTAMWERLNRLEEEEVIELLT